MSAKLLQAFLILGFAVSGAAGVRALASDASPNADEQCVMQCDEASDKCMAEAGGDDRKEQACDDAYSECLARCK